MEDTQRQIMYRNSAALFDAMDKNDVKYATVSLDFEGYIKDMRLFLKNETQKEVDRSSKDWETITFQPIHPQARKPGDTTRSVVSEVRWPNVMGYIAEKLLSEYYFHYKDAPFDPRISCTVTFYPEKNVIKAVPEIYALQPSEGDDIYYMNVFDEKLESL